MKKVYIFFSVLLLGSCSNPGYKETETGIKYKYLKEEGTEIPNDGDVMQLHLLYKADNGKELLNTAADARGPVPILYQSEKFIKNGSIEELFGMLKIGDSIEALIPASRVFESFGQPVPDSIDANSPITFCIGVASVMSRQDYSRSIAEDYMASAKEDLHLSAEQIEADGKIIDAFLAGNNIDASKTESGIRYVITESGEGPTAKPGDRVSVNYVGKVMDGRIFDTSFKEIAEENDIYNPAREPYEPYPFTLGTGEVIYGWDEGLTLLNRGAKATLYIPSSMAYGTQEVNEVITANSILIFEVELVDITVL